MMFDDFDVNFRTFRHPGTYQGLPWDALAAPWAPGCPEEGFHERKAGSVDPPPPKKLNKSLLGLWMRTSRTKNVLGSVKPVNNPVHPVHSKCGLILAFKWFALQVATRDR